ncbi:hypothetical protein ACXDF8_25700 [Mycolicibacterium sp. CBM1]
MDAVGVLSSLLIATAALAALGGYIAGAARERDRRRAKGYFAIGVFTGLLGAAVLRRRLTRAHAVRLVTSRLALPQRSDHPLSLVASTLQRRVSRSGLSR